MKPWILVSVVGVPVLVVVCVLVFRNVQPRSDKELLKELQKLSAMPDLEKENIKTEAAFQGLWKKRGEDAHELLQEFEKHHADSRLLPDAQAEAFLVFVMHHSHAARAAEVAKSLRKNAKDPDLAARADLFLLNYKLSEILAGAKTPEALRDAWSRNADGYRRQLEEHLTAYPKNRASADDAQKVLDLADQVDDPKTRRMIVDLVSKNQPSHPLAKIGKEFQFEFTPVGSAKKKSIKDLRGQVVVIDFWATWCAPCVGEIPNLKDLYKKYHPKLEIIGVSLDKREADLTAFVKKKEVTWPQAFGGEAEELARDWGVQGIPQVYVLDRQGQLYSLNGRGKLETLVPKLLGEK